MVFTTQDTSRSDIDGEEIETLAGHSGRRCLDNTGIK